MKEYEKYFGDADEIVKNLRGGFHMKRRVLAALLSAAMVFSMVGCGAGEKEPAKNDKVSQEDNKLTVWAWDPNFNGYAMEKAAELYAKDHEGFEVEVVEFGSEDVETAITTAVTAGDLSTLPDIFLMQDNSYQKYIANYPDAFTDLTDSGIDFSQFSEAKVGFSKVDGKNYAIPFDNGAVVNCIRTDIIEQAGYSIEDFTDITWTDYMEKAKVVLDKTGVPMLTGMTGQVDLVMMMLQSCGEAMFKEDGSVYIKDNEALKEILKVYDQMVKDGTLVEVVDWSQYIASITNGTVASALNGCWIMASVTSAEDQAGKWAMTNMPKLDGVEGATNYSSYGGASWGISANCKNPELAIDFMKSTFAGSTELYDDIIQKGAIATWAPASESDVYNQPNDFFQGDAVYAKIVDYITKTPASVTGPYYFDGREAIGVALAQIVQDGKDIDSAVSEAEETVKFNIGE